MSRQEIRGTVRSQPRSLASPRVINIHDLRHLAQGRLPRVVFDYLDGGAESEVTLRENCRVFDDVTFRPRQAVAIPECDLRTRVLSADLAFPAILAPIGYSRLMHPGGEIAAAAAAEEAGLAYTLSTISGHKLENVRAASKGPVWYQLYLVGGREVAEGAIDRARRAGFSALVVTIDTPVAGMRERDPRNGMKELLGGSIFSKLPFLPQMFTHPRWLASFLMDGGVRRGSDIVKAICLGARAVLLGRAYAFGLAAAGKPGVTRALEILREDVERTLRLLGCPSVSALDSSYLNIPKHW